MKRDKRCVRASFCFSSRRRHTSFSRDWSSDVCSSDLPASNNRTDGRANSTCGKKNTDAGSCALTHGKYSFAKNCQQREDPTTQPPSGFHKQQSQHARSSFYVACPFDCLADTQSAADSELTLLARRTFGQTHACN